MIFLQEIRFFRKNSISKFKKKKKKTAHIVDFLLEELLLLAEHLFRLTQLLDGLLKIWIVSQIVPNF